MNLYSLLSKIYKEFKHSRFNEAYAIAFNACKKANAEIAIKIASINLENYSTSLRKALNKSYIKARKDNAAAIYFEYDLDNGWDSNFFIYSEYSSETKHDDEWAAHWQSSIKGPSLQKFARLFSIHNGFSNDNIESICVTIFLITRTVITFKEVFTQIQKTADINICIGFHDQDEVWRIYEAPLKSHRIKIAKKLPPLSDSEHVNKLFEPQYDGLLPLSDGLAVAKIGNNYGYIDKFGNETIPFNLAFANSFNSERALLIKNHKTGYIDATGKFAIDPIFDDGKQFAGPGAPVKVNELWGIIGKEGQWLLKPCFDEIIPPNDLKYTSNIFLVHHNGKYGYVRSDGFLLIEPTIELHTKSYPVVGGKKSEYILDFGHAGWFSEGLAPVNNGFVFGYINEKGNQIIEFSQADFPGNVSLGSFRCGIAPILRANEFMFIDKLGKTIIGGGNRCFEFTENRGVIEFLDKKKGSAIVDEKGNIIARSGKRKWELPDGSSQILNLDFGGGMIGDGIMNAISRETGETYFLNMSGKIIARYSFGFNEFHEGVAIIREKWKKYGFINKSFELLGPMEFDGAECFCNGIAVVNKNDKYCFIEHCFNS